MASCCSAYDSTWFGGTYTISADPSMSDDTVCRMQPFCRVDVIDDQADLPTFQEIIWDYLDLTNDEPAAPNS
jgi:hypothetical protein